MRPLRIAFPQMSDARGSPAPNPNDPGLLGPAEVSLLIDLYELTMSASYLERGMKTPRSSSSSRGGCRTIATGSLPPASVPRSS